MDPAAANGQVVLVVDDEVLLRMDAIYGLEDAGFRTLEAGDAEEALEVLQAHPEVAVVFTDINMPGALDGLELARRVHQNRPDVKLIVTSGRQAPRSEDLPDAGQFIAKPYDARSVADMVRSQVH